MTTKWMKEGTKKEICHIAIALNGYYYLTVLTTSVKLQS